MNGIDDLRNKLLYCTTAASSLVFLFLWFRNRKLLNSFRFRKVSETVDYPLINEVLFFSEKHALCYNHDFYSSKCDIADCGLKKLKKIIAYLDSAETSLDVCVFTITSHKLAETIIRKFQQGIRVRIITDASMDRGNESQIPVFRKAGIRVKVRQSTQFLMHHKFAIVDNRLLINGSFNWTRQATFGNWENVLVMNYPRTTVQQYCDQFEELWSTL